MANPLPFIKQISVCRRRANMTRLEFFNHYYNVHGHISGQGRTLMERAHKYIQNHMFDGAFPPPTGGSTFHYHWVGRDGVAEIMFRNVDHLIGCFESDYLNQIIRPDKVNFADGKTTIFMTVQEKPLKLSAHADDLGNLKPESEFSHQNTAHYFIATHEWCDDMDWIDALENEFSQLMLKALEENARGMVYRVVMNVRVSKKDFDLQRHFSVSPKKMPEYSLMCKTYFKAQDGAMAALRKTQEAFEQAAGAKIDTGVSFMLFGKEVVVLDEEQGVQSARHRQSQFSSLV